MTTSPGSTPPSALVVVPTYNERDNLPLLVEGLMRHANVKLLVVDDQSPDGTGEAAVYSYVRRHARGGNGRRAAAAIVVAPARAGGVSDCIGETGRARQ